MYDEQKGLVERAKAGDIDAFGELFERTRRRVYQYIRQMVPNPEDAEDLTQQVYVRAWSALKGLQTNEAFLVWLHRIARHLVLDRSKRARLDTISLQTGYMREEDEENSGIEIVDWSANPELVVLSEATQEAIRQAVRSLPEIYREVVTMHHLEGMEISEIAQVLGIPKNTVLSRLARAREALRHKLSYLVEEK